MKAKNREIIGREAQRQLVQLTNTAPPAIHYAPWLHPDLTYAEVRRTIHRLRTGTMRSPNPEIPEPLLADLLEGAIEKDIYFRRVNKDLRRYRELVSGLEAQEEEERRQSRSAYFNRLKTSPEASDPESPVAERVQRLREKRRSERKRGK